MSGCDKLRLTDELMLGLKLSRRELEKERREFQDKDAVAPVKKPFWTPMSADRLSLTNELVPVVTSLNRGAL
jgi:hypothetical protein